MKQPKEYEVTLGARQGLTLTSGVWYVLATDVESAAWSALELANQSSTDLLNVKLSDEW